MSEEKDIAYVENFRLTMAKKYDTLTERELNESVRRLKIHGPFHGEQYASASHDLNKNTKKWEAERIAKEESIKREKEKMKRLNERVVELESIIINLGASHLL